MSDPLDAPPVDHGSDRYDYVEIDAPYNIVPGGEWWTELLAEGCPDCRANVFAKLIHVPPPTFNAAKPRVVTRECWQISLAHDATCPNADKLGVPR